MASLTTPMPRLGSNSRLLYAPAPILCRQDLTRARRVVIKCGTSVVSNADGHFSLTRLAAIVEQASELLKSGVEVISATCFLFYLYSTTVVAFKPLQPLIKAASLTGFPWRVCVCVCVCVCVFFL
jgi:hypothetical protein